MGGSSHHVDPWPSEYCIIGRFNVKDTKLCDDIVSICSDRELDCAGRPGFTSIEPIEERLVLVFH